MGRILWCAPLPTSPPDDVIAWSGFPPRFFHAPALAAGFDVVPITSLDKFKAEMSRASTMPRIAFIFSLESWHLMALILYCKSIPFILYYQNSWPRFLSFPKRLAAKLALRLARLVLLQDGLCMHHFSSLTKPGKTLFFPWFVDERFFDPSLVRHSAVQSEPWLLVPGDRARLDNVVLGIAKRTPVKILRVSRLFAPGVLEAYSRCPNVTVRHFVPWAELRDLYASASVVLNVVDDTYNSAGMTTFLEALAMNARVITPANHSSSGFAFADGFKPYRTIDRPDDVDAWIREISSALDADPFPVDKTPRRLVVEMAGFDACTARWSEVFIRSLTPRWAYV